MALEATTLALLDSGLLPENYSENLEKSQKNFNLDFHQPTKIGTSFGTTLLGFIDVTKLEQKINETDKFKNSVSPYFIPRILNNTPTGVISMVYNLKGPATSHSEACATGNHSIGDGYLNIKHGRANCMIVGATDSCLDPSVIAGFSRIRALTKESNPKQASIPFDRNRNGFVMGEGAGCLVLEDLESVRARGAESKILGEITGYSATNDAFHITAPSENGEAAYNAMKLVLEEAGTSRIDYINAHATSTPIGDDIELNSIERLFSESQKELPFVSSCKGSLGHLLAAAGSVEAILTIMAVKNNILPHTLNTNVVSSEYENLVLYQPEYGEVRAAISNSFGFGGNNSSVLFEKF